jgi:HEAT repeat protein
VSSGIGVFTLDRDLRIRSWNQWLVAATGLPEADVRGRLATEFAPSSRAALLHEVLTEVLDTGVTRVLSPALHRCIVVCPPGTPTSYFSEMQQSVTVAPLRSDDGVVGVIVTVEDVTERLVAERELADRDPQSVSPGDRNLVSDAGAGDWRVRAAATRILKQTATREQVAELLTNLERDHQNFSVLSGALDVLIGVNRGVTGPLIELLADPSPNLRMHAALALGGIGGEEAVSALVAALDDEDSNVRFHAIESLGRLGAAEAVDSLARVAMSGDFFLAFPAVDALGKIDSAGVLPVLLSLLDDELLRPAIIDALSTLGDEDCIVPLTRLLDEGQAEPAAIASAIERIASRYEETLGDGAQIIELTRRALTPAGIARVCDAVRARVQPLWGSTVVAGWLGQQGLAAVLSVIDVAELRPAVAAAVAALGREAVGPLLDVLAGGSREARITAAGLLGRLGDPRAAEALVESLSSHDTELVTASVGALAALAAPESLDALVRLFAHPDVMVRQGALAAVHSMRDERVRTHVKAALASGDSRVRECGIRVAGYFGFDDCVPDVLDALRDPSDDVRRAAIEQLPLLDDPRCGGLLLTALHTESARNRGAAAHALRLIETPGGEAALLAALSDSDAWVRYFAAGSLEARGTVQSIPRLTHAARTDIAPHVRIAAMTALAAVAPSELAGVVSALAEDPDENVAAAAVAALAHVHGAAADTLLERALRAPSSEMRLAAAAALAHRTTCEAVKALEWAAQLSEPPTLAALALNGLRKVAEASGSEAGSAAIHALLALGAAPARREQVAGLLGALPRATVPVLRDALRTAATEVRILAIQALARMRDGEASHVIATALGDDAPAVRSAAVAAVGRLGSSIARRQVQAISVSDPSPSVRSLAAAVCRRHGWGLEQRRDDR